MIFPAKDVDEEQKWFLLEKLTIVAIVREKVGNFKYITSQK